MTLNPNWKLILKKAWSVRLLIVAAILSGLEMVFPLYADSFPRGLFAVTYFIIVSAAIIARLVAQKDFADEN